MAIQVYNTLTRKKEELRPIAPDEIRMYVCGVTVYDECHIGHARGAFVFEVIRRYLRHRGFKVTYVRNITDVDDKIIERARQEHDPRNLTEAVRVVAQRYTQQLGEDLALLGIPPPDLEPKATEHIPRMIQMIERLVERGFAYRANGDVYYDVGHFPTYGQLSHQKLEEMQAGVRIAPDEKKQDPLDFALWKQAKPDEPSWPSPWGPGRPGWHIECSTMSTQSLGNEFDIHGGGLDLIFPHHENEIAQAQAATGQGFARYWLHNGLVTFRGEKMSKSLGNFVSIRELSRRYHPEVLKMLFLAAHYRSPVDFTWERMEEAKLARERLYVLLDKAEQLTESSPAAERRGEAFRRAGLQVQAEQEKFLLAMDDDFNTPEALSRLFALVDLGHRALLDSQLAAEEKVAILRRVVAVLKELGQAIGLFEIVRTELREEALKARLVELARQCASSAQTSGRPAPPPEDQASVPQLIQWLVERRNEARHQRQFQLGDEIRAALQALDVVLEDRKLPELKTTWRIR